LFILLIAILLPFIVILESNRQYQSLPICFTVFPEVDNPFGIASVTMSDSELAVMPLAAAAAAASAAAAARVDLDAPSVAMAVLAVGHVMLQELWASGIDVAFHR
jgi:hypothetical protein